MQSAASLERTITAVAARCLRGEVPVDATTQFDELGLDSLATIELATALESELGCALPADILAGCTDARSLAARLSALVQARGTDDPFEQMLADAALPEDVRPPSHPPISPDLRDARTILFTGATGFLGRALVEELLETSSARLVCLVRPGHLKSAPTETGQTATPVGAGFSRPDRIQLLEGDLSHHRLGLSQSVYDALVRDVDAVCHCGAAVNWVYSYASLRSANVLGTLELLRLASRAGASFHFISSLSACYSTDGPRVVDESFDALTELRGVHLGYAQTKIVGEALVREAGRRGLPARVYRPALISGHSATGAYNRDDLIATLVRGCVRMGTAPDLDWQLDAQPVDVVASAIVRLSNSSGPVFHMSHPRPRHWRECVLWMRLYGYAIRLVSYAAWLRQLERDTGNDASHPLRPLRSFFLDRPTGTRGLTLPELYEERRRTHASGARSNALLAEAGLTCPPLDAGLLNTYFAAFIAAGDLPAPSGAVHAPAVGRASRSGVQRVSELLDNLTIISAGSDHSIISELTAWRSHRPTGLFRARVTATDGTCRDAIVKVKARDTDVIAVGESLADLVDATVGRAYRRWSDRVGLLASHAREIAIYRQNDPRFLRHAPAVLATIADESSSTWVAVLEHMHDAALIDSADRRESWKPRHIRAAIDGLAELHSLWFGRDAELQAQSWIGHVQSAASMAEMRDLWSALADHAAPFFSSWADPDVTRIHKRLIADVEEWWTELERGPRTLIHHDFNPRNICLRGEAVTLCAYDWELATLGAPQRDLAEFLCFVLPHDVESSDVLPWLERHRSGLQQHTGSRIDDAVWISGFRSALYDVLVNRLSMYAMVHRVRRQSFLPRVVKTWRTLYHLFPLEGPS